MAGTHTHRAGDWGDWDLTGGMLLPWAAAPGWCPPLSKQGGRESGSQPRRFWGSQGAAASEGVRPPRGPARPPARTEPSRCGERRQPLRPAPGEASRACSRCPVPRPGDAQHTARHCTERSEPLRNLEVINVRLTDTDAFSHLGDPFCSLLTALPSLVCNAMRYARGEVENVAIAKLHFEMEQ